MSLAQTISDGWTSTLQKVNPTKSLQTPKTKAIAKARDKAGHTWCELVEAAHREKAEPEAFVIERLGAEIGLDPSEAVAAFQADKKDFAKAQKALVSLDVVIGRLAVKYAEHGEQTEVGFTTKRRLEREALVKQIKEIDVDLSYQRSQSVAWMGYRVDLRKTGSNRRLFPDGVVKTYTTTKE